MQSMNPFISNELFSWMSIWSHELLVSDSGGQEEEKEEKEREWERHQCWFDHTLVWTSMPHFTFRIGNWKWKKTKRKEVLEYKISILQYFYYSMYKWNIKHAVTSLAIKIFTCKCCKAIFSTTFFRWTEFQISSWDPCLQAHCHDNCELRPCLGKIGLKSATSQPELNSTKQHELRRASNKIYELGPNEHSEPRWASAGQP